MREIRSRFPSFTAAVRADAELTARYRGEPHEMTGRIALLRQVARLCWVSDAFLAQVLYRAKASLQAHGVPLLPRIAHRLSMLIAQVSIGDPVVVHPGIYVIHGQIVVDGLVEIGSGTVIAPWVTIGLSAGNVQGATIEPGVHLGTGAKIIGPVRIGRAARVGANAVVLVDVDAEGTVVGVPARAA